MKKVTIGIVFVIIILCTIYYSLIEYRAQFIQIEKQNMEYESYVEKEITGTQLATVINKVINNNIKNDVHKDEDGLYVENSENSIILEVKMLDTDKIYRAETLYNGGIEKFIKYYYNIKFKCTNVKYYENTNKIKYMLFEQITQ